MILGQIGPMVSDRGLAFDIACDHADRTNTPCGVWARDGWYAASEVAPDADEFDDREALGWELDAVADPLSAVWAEVERDVADETVRAWGVA
jgi:hypothetical protein